MIEQDTNGLSLGNQLEGVMIDVKMLNFVPIHKSKLCQKTLIIDWIRTWASCPELEPLTEKEWLWEGQVISDKNCTNVDRMEFTLKDVNDFILWNPLTCIDDVAVELMSKYHH